jgi:hypothetical protein
MLRCLADSFHNCAPLLRTVSRAAGFQLPLDYRFAPWRPRWDAIMLAAAPLLKFCPDMSP